MADAKPQPRPRKRKPEYRPWHPEDYEPGDAYAIQALSRGEATPEQQRRALQWIVVNLARSHDVDFFPDSERDSAFAAGKRSVGLQVLKLMQINISKLFSANAVTEQP